LGPASKAQDRIMTRVAVYGYLSIDTIEVGGRRHEGVPGGGALYAALGARAAGASPAIVAAVGEDYPSAWLAAIGAAGIDTSRVEHRAGPTRRARLAHRSDGQRRSPHHAEWLWRERSDALAPGPSPIAADAAVICPMPLAAAETIRAAASGLAVADTSEAFAAEDPEGWRRFAAALTVFAPSREETRLLCPGLDDDEAMAHLAAGGAAVVQKRGAEGLALHADGIVLRIASPEVRAVDPTGAGDATVGAIAARLALGDDLPAACRVAVNIGARAVSALGAAALGLAPVLQAAE
jgi:ribokinase